MGNQWIRGSASGGAVARLISDVLNPFVIFTILYAFVAFTETSLPGALLYFAVELAAAGAVAGYVLLLRWSKRVGDFWISRRAERAVPVLVLLVVFAALQSALLLLGAPQSLFLIALSMGLAAAVVAGITIFWKASAHSAVAGHAAAAGLLLLGPAGFIFAAVLLLVIYGRVALGAHTLAQSFTGALIGAGCAFLLLAG